MQLTPSLLEIIILIALPIISYLFCSVSELGYISQDQKRVFQKGVISGQLLFLGYVILIRLLLIGNP